MIKPGDMAAHRGVHNRRNYVACPGGDIYQQ